MLDQLYSTDSVISDEAPLIWMARMIHQNTRGQPMTFTGKPFLIELYRDLPDLDEMVLRKAVQVGISELYLLYILYMAGWQGKRIAYCLPTGGIKNRFVSERVDPLLMSVPAYRERTPGSSLGEKKGAASLSRKRFGRGSLMFLCSNVVNDFNELTADVFIIDEYDQCDPTNVAKARDRIRESPHPQLFRVSNPSIPGVGISKLFDESDGRHWFLQCPHCGLRQYLDWYANIVQRTDSGPYRPRDVERAAQGMRLLSNGRVIVNPESPDIRPCCAKCSKPFDRRDGGVGEWVPLRRYERVRGYTMSRLDVLTDRLFTLYAEFMAAQGDSVKMAAWIAGTLGKAYEGAGTQITRDDLNKCANGPEMDWNGGDHYAKQRVSMGVDVGSALNVMISSNEGTSDIPKRRNVWSGAVGSFDDVKDLIKRYHVGNAVLDAQPEARKCQEIRDYYIQNGGCQVWLCSFFPNPRVGAQRYGWSLDWQAQKVSVDRTQVFDCCADDIWDNNRVFPSDIFSVNEWDEQMRAPKRILEGNRIVWSKTSAPDHYRLADVYDRVAFDLSSMGGTYVTM